MLNMMRILLLLAVLVISLLIEPSTLENYTQKEIIDILKKDEKIQKLISAK